MRIYYAKSTGGFYNDDIHGARRVNVPDPRWERPTLEMPSPDWKPKGEQTEEDRPSVVVSDENALQPLVEIDNLACLIPSDAVEISAEEHALLSQSPAADVIGLANGKPSLQPHKVTETEVRAERDRLLLATDWVTARAIDQGEGIPTPWREYRQQLRDVTEQPGFPQRVNWPVLPEA